MNNEFRGAFVGGHPALDFVNTVIGNDKNRERSRIGDWDHFQSWAIASNMFRVDHVKRLDTVSESSNCSSILEAIHYLRETAYSMLSSIASGGVPSGEHRACIEAHIKVAVDNGVLNYSDNMYEWVVAVDHPNWLIDTLALSMENLLRSEDFRKLRECGRCSWFFLDTGRGKGRKWCDMSTCGNRYKSESFRNRRK